MLIKNVNEQYDDDGGGAMRMELMAAPLRGTYKIYGFVTETDKFCA